MKFHLRSDGSKKMSKECKVPNVVSPVKQKNVYQFKDKLYANKINAQREQLRNWFSSMDICSPEVEKIVDIAPHFYSKIIGDESCVTVYTTSDELTFRNQNDAIAHEQTLINSQNEKPIIIHH